ncbi:hypothetical protein [Haloarcula rara]|uniref:hypothetical protein n=1 Tax=Haloarcula rara TaxID=3033387 RepID=UPI0023E87F33|nr:hypothetical protein [Halomicroarcula sp. SHR3]
MSKPINSALEDVAGDDTLVYLPPGRYRMDEAWSQMEFENFGIYGPDATLVPPSGYDDDLFVLGNQRSARRLLLDGLTFDVSATGTGPRIVHATVADGLLVRDVSVTGLQDTGRGLTRFDVTDPDGRGQVQRLELPDGGAPNGRATGCLVGPQSEGRIAFHDCTIVGFPDNGLYASPSPGIVDVYGGRYANNGIASVRVSGGGVVSGVHVVCDESRDGVENMRGIRLRGGSGTIVRNCRIEITEVTDSGGAMTLSNAMGSATIEGTVIRVDAEGVPAIRAKRPSEAGENGATNRLVCENVAISGSTSEKYAIRVVGREGSKFRNLCVRQLGQNRDGIVFVQSDGSAVTHSQLNVTGDPIVEDQSQVRTSGVDTGGTNSCEGSPFSARTNSRASAE